MEGLDQMICPYNPDHRVHESELEEHMLCCPDSPWGPEKPEVAKAAKQEAEKRLTVNFSPGRIGLKTYPGQGIVSAVLEGQAQEQGVKVGMRMTRIGGQQYSRELLSAKASGTEDFEVEFIDEVCKLVPKISWRETAEPAQLDPTQAQCPFNPGHRMPMSALAKHIQKCPDRLNQGAGEPPSKKARPAGPALQMGQMPSLQMPSEPTVSPGTASKASKTKMSPKEDFQSAQEKFMALFESPEDLASKFCEFMSTGGLDQVVAMTSTPSQAQSSQKSKKKRKASEISGTNGEMPAWDAHAAGVKGRTDADRMAAKKIYAMYKAQRLDIGTDVEGVNAESDDWWYGQVCLCCLVECDLNCYRTLHRGSARHKKTYAACGGLSLKPGVLRPNPNPLKPLAPENMAQFLQFTRFAGSTVLSLGEQDYSFSLSVARHQALMSLKVVSLVATSYLAAHDPSEPEIHVKDDGMKAHYSRRSLPSMEGMLQQNIDAIKRLGGFCLHSVDATDLRKTLLTQCPATCFDVIVFPFPRASLLRGTDPRNPQLVRNFFLSVCDTGILGQGGRIELLLLRSQYPDWDISNVAAEAGFSLTCHTRLPEGFYQSREMSGKKWSPQDAEVYIFERMRY